MEMGPLLILTKLSTENGKGQEVRTDLSDRLVPRTCCSQFRSGLPDENGDHKPNRDIN